ncbi:MAG: M42 family peptidase [Clostridia bacterium]|nr:M42 family peptidase [Clostridia bacterium]
MDLKLLEELCCVSGVSGNENSIRNLLAEKMKDFSPEIDCTGNLVCIKKSKFKDAPCLMLDAHMDSIGLCITEICERGFLKFSAVGGVDERILPATEVLVHGKKDVFGVVSTKPPHLKDKNDQDTVSIDSLFIDTGENSDGISIGDKISYAPKFKKMLNSVSGTYLDNRVGCLAIIDVFMSLNDKELPFDLKAVFSVGEEMGMKGAKYGQQVADMGIVLDVTFGKTPDETSDEALEIGGGAAIGVGPNVNKKISGGLLCCAKDNNINCQVEVLEGCSGTNAWMYQVKGLGIPVGMVSFPIKYMHTPVETMKISDYEDCVKLLVDYILGLTGEQISEISGVEIC